MLVVVVLLQKAQKGSDRRQDSAASVRLASVCADCICVRGGERPCV